MKKPSIYERTKNIREIINIPRVFNKLDKEKNWNKICSSLDMIEDTELLFEAYKKTQWKRITEGKKYLHIFGLLQGIFVQQDAIESLCLGFGIIYNLKKDYPQIHEIREIRNDTIGHPTNRKGGKEFCFISRPTLEKRSFEYLKFPDKGDLEPKRVLTDERIEEQVNFCCEMLDKLLLKLVKEEKDHKERFRMKKVSDVFHDSLPYIFGKLKSSILDVDYKLGESHLKMIKKTLYSFKNSLVERDEFDCSETIKDLYKWAEYSINRIESILEMSASDGSNGRDAYIFAFFLESKFEELKDIAKEIDKEYQS